MVETFKSFDRVVQNLKSYSLPEILFILNRYRDTSRKRTEINASTVVSMWGRYGTGIVFVVGKPGTGKSTFGQVLSHVGHVRGREIVYIGPEQEDYELFHVDTYYDKIDPFVKNTEKGDHDGSIVIMEESVVTGGVGKGRVVLHSGYESLTARVRHFRQLHLIITQHTELSEAMKRVMLMSSSLYMNPVDKVKITDEEYRLFYDRWNKGPKYPVKVGLIVTPTILLLPPGRKNDVVRELQYFNYTRFRVVFDDAYRRIVYRLNR
jgi:hypothetical protein